MKFFYILFLVAIILLSGCATQPATNQTQPNDPETLKTDLQSIIPSGWTMRKESVADEKPEDGVVARFRIISNKQCQREVTFKPNPEPINQTINPWINVIYMKKWTQQDYDKENKRYQDCVKQITEQPQLAMGCSKNTPTVDTKNYSVFMNNEDKCINETADLKDKIVNYLKSL